LLCSNFDGEKIDKRRRRRARIFESVARLRQKVGDVLCPQDTAPWTEVIVLWRKSLRPLRILGFFVKVLARRDCKA